MKIKSTHPESQGPFVEIDEENFDPNVHEKYVEGADEDKGTSGAAKDMTVAELKDALTAAEITFPADAKKADLVALLEAKDAE